MQTVLNIAVSLFPVIIFLAALIVLDSFKLIRMRPLTLSILSGAIIAVVCYFINAFMLQHLFPNPVAYSRYFAPILEESLKSCIVVYLIRQKRVGFMVDAAIYGFAVGTGFAFMENLYFVETIQNSNILLWILRGFGTAIMHGGTTAIVGISSKMFIDRYPERKWQAFAPGIVIAIAVHSFFNHFFLSPAASTALLLIGLPALLAYIFKQSEKMTRDWLGANLDADMELLDLMSTGSLPESKIGLYLLSLKSRFAPEVIIDMLCLLRIHTELSVKSKGLLMMREAGFDSPPDPEVKEKFAEMKYLEKSIGTTGKMAILPFLHTTSQSLWQIYMLEK